MAKEYKYYRMRVKLSKPNYKNLFVNALVMETARPKAVAKLKKELEKLAEREKLNFEITKIENLQASIVL